MTFGCRGIVLPIVFLSVHYSAYQDYLFLSSRKTIEPRAVCQVVVFQFLIVVEEKRKDLSFAEVKEIFDGVSMFTDGRSG